MQVGFFWSNLWLCISFVHTPCPYFCVKICWDVAKPQVPFFSHSEYNGNLISWLLFFSACVLVVWRKCGTHDHPVYKTVTGNSNKRHFKGNKKTVKESLLVCGIGKLNFRHRCLDWVHIIQYRNVCLRCKSTHLHIEVYNSCIRWQRGNQFICYTTKHTTTYYIKHKWVFKDNSTICTYYVILAKWPPFATTL